MPELPEVETLRRDLSPCLLGRRIVAAEITKPRMLITLVDSGFEAILHQPIVDLRRRAKMLIFDFTNDISMVMHLKLAGQLILRNDGTTLVSGGHPVPAFDAEMPHKSTHGRFDLDDGGTLWLTDIRQFARVTIVSSAFVDEYMASKKLGVEPLDVGFTLDYFASQLKRRAKLSVKGMLLDQSGIVGLGNIYVDEALYGAQIHPSRRSGSLDTIEIKALHAAILESLNYALDNGVADLPAGKVRPDSDFPRAHGRHRLPCLRCATIMERIKLEGRSTDFCPVCQPTPPLDQMAKGENQAIAR